MGSRGAACGRRPRRRPGARRGCRAATDSARAQPVAIQRAGDDQRRGARPRPRRSWSGSMAPCPAPRRLAARPAGRLRRRSARRRAARPDGSAAWLAKTGSRSHSSTNASIPSRSSAIGAAPRRAARRAARSAGSRSPPTGSRGRGVATTVGCGDRQPQGDPRAERVAERRAAAATPQASRIAARSSRGALDRRRARVGGVPDRPCPGRSTTTSGTGRAKAGRVRAPARSRGR